MLIKTNLILDIAIFTAPTGSCHYRTFTLSPGPGVDYRIIRDSVQGCHIPPNIGCSTCSCCEEQVSAEGAGCIEFRARPIRITSHMKKIFILLALLTLALASCSGGSNQADEIASPQEATAIAGIVSTTQ